MTRSCARSVLAVEGRIRRFTLSDGRLSRCSRGQAERRFCDVCLRCLEGPVGFARGRVPASATVRPPDRSPDVADSPEPPVDPGRAGASRSGVRQGSACRSCAASRVRRGRAGGGRARSRLRWGRWWPSGRCSLSCRLRAVSTMSSPHSNMSPRGGYSRRSEPRSWGTRCWHFTCAGSLRAGSRSGRRRGRTCCCSALATCCRDRRRPGRCLPPRSSVATDSHLAGRGLCSRSRCGSTFGPCWGSERSRSSWRSHASIPVSAKRGCGGWLRSV